MKNYENTANNKSTNLDGFNIEISFIGATEPSAISMSLPIKEPTKREDIKRPNYFPSYSSLSPQQRWIYLDWLRDVDREINIGYVFIFYYGLERHLFLGDLESAFDMILRLRKKHKNSSFTSYSSNALLAACIFHKRNDLFMKYIQSIEKVDDISVNAIYTLAKKALGMGLTAQELIKISGNVGFKNRRYLKDESVLFEQELRNILLERFSIDEMPLSNFELRNCPIIQQPIIANYSFDNQQRLINIPSIIKNKAFSDEAFELLYITHERVRLLLERIRSAGSFAPQIQNKTNNPNKEVSDSFKKSTLFEAIDVHMFDKNVECFNKGLCPYCNNQLQKRPAHKGKCNHCGLTILVKNSVFTGQKLMLTEDEYKQMVIIREERTYRKWVKTMLSSKGINISKFAQMVKNRGISIEEAMIEMMEDRAQNHYMDSEMGLHRNCIMQLGNIYERMGQLDSALNYYLLVCYYDLRGCTNSSKEYRKELSSLAPAVVAWVGKLGKALNLSREQMKDKYQSVIKHLKESDIATSIDNTWNEIEKALYNPE